MNAFFFSTLDIHNYFSFILLIMFLQNVIERLVLSWCYRIISVISTDYYHHRHHLHCSALSFISTYTTSTN